MENIKSILSDAIEKRLLADVPVGSFLSGGIDSSFISAVIAEKKKDFDTFSIGFRDKSYNELDFSKIVAKHIKTRHHYQYLDIDESLIEYLIENMDEPFGDSSVLPTYLLSKITRQKVTVTLSGDAGDEIFAGYDSYKAYKIAKYIPSFALLFIKYLVNLIPPSDSKLSLGFKLKRFERDFTSNPNTRHLNWMATFTNPTRSILLSTCFIPAEQLIDCSSNNGLLRLQLNDIHNYLAEDILKKLTSPRC